MAAQLLATSMPCVRQGLPLPRRLPGNMQTANLAPFRLGMRSLPEGIAHRSSRGKQAFIQRAYAVEADDVISEAIAEVEEEEEFEDEDDGSGLTTQQVHTLLHVMCQETEIAEVELQMGSFEMRVRRSVKGGAGASSLSAYSTNGSEPVYPTPAPGTAFASTASMDIPAGDMPQMSMSQASMDSDDFDDESSIFLTAPKVGLMRRSRYVKGKRVGKGNLVSDGDEVKAGQILGFIEQLGTFMPIEAPQAGEIVSFAVEEGQPVEYNQPLVEIAPFFGGHIIGDRKHA